MKTFLQKRIPLSVAFLPVLLIIVAFGATACFDSQTDASNQNATTASQKWGNSPNITNYYEYLQLKQVYEERDNPKLILNAYLYSEVTGQFTCLGKVKGFGIPYGTQWSQPITGNGQGSVPEPNGLYPSTSTNADWVQIVDANGKTHISFVEPNLVITDMSFPCTPLKGTSS